MDNAAVIFPHSHQLERTLLRAMIAGNRIPHCRLDHFYVDAHRHLFSTLKEIVTTGIAVSADAIRDGFREPNLYEAIGGAEFIDALLSDPIPADEQVTDSVAVLAGR